MSGGVGCRVEVFGVQDVEWGRGHQVIDAFNSSVKLVADGH